MIVDGNFIKAADPGNPSGYARDQIANIILGSSPGDGGPELEYRRLHERLLLWRLRLLRPRHRLVAGRLVLRRLPPPAATTRARSRTATRPAGSTPRRPARRCTPAWIDYTGTDSHLLGRGHLGRGVHRRPLPLAEQSLRSGQPAERARSRVRVLPPSTPPTASRWPGTRAVTRAGTAPRRSTRRQRVSGSAATPTGSATTSTSARSSRSSPSPAGTAATGNDTGDPRTVFVAGAQRHQQLHAPTRSTRRRAPVPWPRASRAPAAASTGARSSGAFVLNGRIWYGQGGKFYYVSWDGAEHFGTPQLVDPYNDPYWDNVADRLGRGNDLPGHGRGLLRRAAQRDRHVLRQRHDLLHACLATAICSAARSRPTPPLRRSPTRSPAASSARQRSPLTRGRRLGRFLQCRRHVPRRTATSGTRPSPTARCTRSPGTARPTPGRARVDTAATGNWAGKAVFVSPVAPRRPAPTRRPARRIAVSCPNATCSFDASASTAPGSSISSYSWDFGDGTTGSGVKARHTYRASAPTRSSSP